MKAATCIACLLTGVALPPPAQEESSAPDLKIAYGANGIQTLSYGQQELENLDRYPADSFHIWHMRVTNLQGEVLSQGQYGWGENHNQRKWDAPTRTWLYAFVWGSIRVQFIQAGSRLDMRVTQTNRTDSGVIFDGAVIYPFGLHLPAPPSAFPSASSPQLSDNVTSPGVMVADFGTGEVATVFPDSKRPLYSGFWPIGSDGRGYTPLIGSTAPDGFGTFQSNGHRPLKPGETDTFTLSVRFGATGVPGSTIGRDAYANWAKAWPQELRWADRRGIGTVYLASSPQGRVDQPAGFPNNPRRYFNDGNSSDFDVRSQGGLTAFQARVLKQAQTNVDSLTKLHAQGAITWDIEGEEYPQSTSYVCEPDAIGKIAPEMESIITDPDSPYRGMKLDDAYFKIMTSAGFRVGVCVRPQHFTPAPNGTAQQVSLPDNAVASELIRKMRFAQERWGATLFYVDSSVDRNGATLSADIFQQVARAFPDSLLIPEESTFKFYAYTAPFQSFLFHGDLGTDSKVRASYPHAFSVNLVNDVNPAKLAGKAHSLTNAVRGGDILMSHADYWQENNPVVVGIYQAAKSQPAAMATGDSGQRPKK